MSRAELHENMVKTKNEEKKAMELVFSLKAALLDAAPENREGIGRMTYNGLSIKSVKIIVMIRDS